MVGRELCGAAWCCALWHTCRPQHDHRTSAVLSAHIWSVYASPLPPPVPWLACCCASRTHAPTLYTTATCHCRTQARCTPWQELSVVAPCMSATSQGSTTSPCCGAWCCQAAMCCVHSCLDGQHATAFLLMSCAMERACSRHAPLLCCDWRCRIGEGWIVIGAQGLVSVGLGLVGLVHRA